MSTNAPTASALPAVLAAFVPDALSSASIAALLLFGRDGGLTAKNAALALRALFASITPADLQRLAVGQSQPAAWLTELAQAATAAHSALRAERELAATTLREDAAGRKQLDLAAGVLMSRATEEAEALLAQAEGIEASDRELRETLDGAGFTAEQVKAIVLARQGDGLMASKALAKREQATTAQARAATLEKFLCDPLRRSEVLGESLLSELAARVAAAAV